LKDINLTGDSVITPAAFTAFTDPWGWGFDTELVYDICVRDNIDLKFVKRAKGSTAISYLYGTENGRWSADYERLTGTQYSLIRQAEKMIKFHKDSAWDYRAIVWHQGEADCAPHLAATYKERFLAMITEMKRLIGREDLPVIIGGLGDFLPKRSPGGALDNYAEVNRAFREIADENALIGFASAEGLGDRGDNLHFSSPALYEFGLRYLDAFEKISAYTEENGENRSTGEPKFTEMELL
jgi:hypothetical protein